MGTIFYFVTHQSIAMATHKHFILYAEDDPDDLFFVKEAFERYDRNIELLHAGNGLEALQKLNKMAEALPCLIILDINMPGLNGKDALIRIKQSEIFSRIPVVLFSTSSSDGDRVFALKWGAELITKPLHYSDLEKVAENFITRCESEVSKRA
jgi:DNA-binding response OmpR family regulator